MQQSTGKIRRLQQCATLEGRLVIMAMDHRQNLRRALNPRDPSSVPDGALSLFKQEVVSALAPASSAVLLDPEYGAGPCITSGALPGDTGLIVALERTGYAGTPVSRETELLPDWGPQRALQLGASGVKLLVYYHPQASTASSIEDLVQKTASACASAEMPLFLEPLTYPLNPERSGFTPEERRYAVIETARRLTAIPGVDVLKVEFPLDISAEHDQGLWLAACRELTKASRVPWVLLSAGVEFEDYMHQVVSAVRAGASGVAAGRAVWKEATGLAGAVRTNFLRTTARQRMERIAALCYALG